MKYNNTKTKYESNGALGTQRKHEEQNRTGEQTDRRQETKCEGKPQIIIPVYLRLVEHSLAGRKGGEQTKTGNGEQNMTRGYTFNTKLQSSGP